ncbi:MAG: DUF3147 family protein [Sedimentisphaerales bacterium]|nr:DUF3147 family protein [Sedimentisphaerales bacterium]
MDAKFFLKLAITVVIIIFCSQIGRKAPTLAGLIATAPITTLIVLMWLWSDKSGDFKLMTDYTVGVLWGIIPTVLFFLAAFFCFRKHLSILPTLAVSSAIWLVSAVVHQLILILLLIEKSHFFNQKAPCVR